MFIDKASRWKKYLPHASLSIPVQGERFVMHVWNGTRSKPYLNHIHYGFGPRRFTFLFALSSCTKSIEIFQVHRINNTNLFS